MSAVRRCVFCGGSPITAEHVWPAWAAGLIPDDVVVPHTTTAEVAGERTQSQTFRQKVFEQRVKVVCASCNNGWMSALEDANKPFLDSALHGRGRALHSTSQRLLAAWSLKSAIVVNRGLFRQHRTGIPERHVRYLFEHRVPPPDVGVWLSSFSASEPGRVFANGMAVSRPDEIVTDADEPNVYTVTFTFGPVVVQVCGCADPEGTGLRPAEFKYPVKSVHKIWPPPQKSVTWTASRPMDVPTLERFAVAIFGELNRRIGRG